MATYITGLTEYVPQIQPFVPDYNFLGNVLQTKQSRYDAGHKQLSSLYGSLLNSPMSRLDNIQERDAFFKSIDYDIKKISGLDLSLKQNQNAAEQIFQPFLDNKNLIKDMTLTKKYQTELNKAENLKYCADPEKCGGQYWDTGVNALHYKMEEFKNISREEALNFNLPTFDPYYNWQKDAIKLAKDADLNVSMDSVSGNWIVSDKNGNLIQGGLYNLFKSVYGNDPRVDNNYGTSAYVTRKSTIANAVANGMPEDAAEREYINKTINEANSILAKNQTDINNAHAHVTSRKNQLEKKAATKGLLPEEGDILNRIGNVKQNLEKTQKSLEISHNSINEDPFTQDINILRRKADNARAQSLQHADFISMAQTLSLKNMEHKIEANPYGLATHSSNLALRNSMKMADVNQANDLIKMSAKLNAQMTYFDYTHGKKSGALNQDPGTILPNSSWAYSNQNKADENIEGGSLRNEKTIAERQLTAKAGSTQFAWDAFQTAKNAAKTSEGARQYLIDTYGANWNNIKTQDDLIAHASKMKFTPQDVFENALKTFAQDKNPYGDMEWAQNFIQQKSKDINDIRINNQAASSLAKFHSDNNRKIVEDLQSRSSGQGEAYLRDADLLLTPGGYVMHGEEAPQEFISAYRSRHGTTSGAEDAYDALKSKFYDTFNQTKNVMLDQGYGLTGSGMVTANPVLHSNVDASQFQDSRLIKAQSIIKNALVGSEATGVIIGKPDQANIAAQKDNPALKSFMDKVLRDMNNPKSGLRFDFIESPIAGNNEGLSAITVKLDPKYIQEQGIGTKSSPGGLYGIKDQLLANPEITMYYDNSLVKTPTTEGTKMDPLEAIVRTQPVVISDPKVGDVTMTYDDASGQVLVNSTITQFSVIDNKFVKNTIPGVTRYISLGDMKTQTKKINETMYLMQKANVEVENRVAAYNKSHPENPIK